ncbi:MAG: sigma-70 family RNA polymerase sigma factor [Candidatus Methylomirabilales bacterium]
MDLPILVGAVSLRSCPGQEFHGEVFNHLTALYNFALSMTQNEDDAADLVQETYLRALRFQHQFQPGTNLRAWLFKILRNVLNKSYLRRSREPTVEDPELEEGAATLAEAERVRGREAASLVRVDVNAALKRLSNPFQTTILLSDVEGFSVEEIADIMGCPKNTVKTRLFRGRALLRKRLRDYRN